MDEVLRRFADRPRRELHPGETLITQGSRGSALYVLVTGGVEVRQGEIIVTTVREPGAFLGEIAALLDLPYGADVVAVEPSSVVVVDPAAEAIAADPDLALAIARLLARRLRAVTAYLTDLRRQYASTGSHLALMDRVLNELTTSDTEPIEPGSERDDVPDY
jgi:CRP/FNR family transcriptional regulator, cyclic AMP receptor protein